MRYFYHVQWKTYSEKKWHHSSKRFISYEDAETFLDSQNHDEGKINLRKAR